MIFVLRCGGLNLPSEQEPRILQEDLVRAHASHKCFVTKGYDAQYYNIMTKHLERNGCN